MSQYKRERTSSLVNNYLNSRQRKWFFPPTRPAKMTPSNSLTAPHVFLQFYIVFTFLFCSAFPCFLNFCFLWGPYDDIDEQNPLLHISNQVATCFCLDWSSTTVRQMPRPQIKHRHIIFFFAKKNTLSKNACIFKEKIDFVHTNTVFVLQTAYLNFLWKESISQICKVVKDNLSAVCHQVWSKMTLITGLKQKQNWTNLWIRKAGSKQ